MSYYVSLLLCHLYYSDTRKKNEHLNEHLFKMHCGYQKNRAYMSVLDVNTTCTLAGERDSRDSSFQKGNTLLIE